MRRFLAALALAFSIPASASTYTVDDTGDGADFNPGDDVCSTAAVGGVCTLRAAIMEANAHGGADAIEFDTTGVLVPATEYPAIIETLTIDGRTAPGYASAPLIAIDGSASSLAIGLHFDGGSGQSELIALQLSGFSETAVLVDSDEATIRRNWLGPVTQGTPNLDGLRLNGDGSTVGGADDGGNVISGNAQFGILVTGTNHVISNNFIGVDETGAAALPNFDDGISIDGGATGVRVGSDTEGEENVISGNFDTGVTIVEGTGNTIAGNFIGTDESGIAAVPNFIGIEVLDSGNTIGTTTAANLISGNDDDGIDVLADDTVIRNNVIGPDATGAAGLGNFGWGIFADTVTNLEVGGSAADEGNVISFNGADGIVLFSAEDSRVRSNVIGLDLAGTNILGNGGLGILMIDSSLITVGSNVVSGNSEGGIVDAGGIDNVMEDNRVGTTSDGNGAAGNLGTGIELFATVNDIVRSNVISANGGHGVETTFGSSGALIHSNIIGLGADLTTELGNFGDGVNVCDGASDTVVGDVVLGGNTITGNGANGIGVEPTALTNNTWAANSIYENEILGIDIDQDLVTPNDEDDPDEGANHLQNFPELDTAVTSPTASQVRGTLNTLPSTDFLVHFYSSPAADPSGFGEGKTYLGFLAGTTDANGDAEFVFNGPALDAGDFVTATATTVDGTSEFSAVEGVQAAPTVAFSSATYSVGEGGVSIDITVTRSGNLDVVSTVDFTTIAGTATGNVDYGSTSGTLTFLSGDDSETFTITINQDALDEADETVLLFLQNPGGAELGDPDAAELTITDDDDPPSITVNDPSGSEGNNVSFTITLSAPSGLDVTVEYDTADGSASDTSDYTAQSNTATILAGNTTATVNVPTTEDAVFEGDETFTLALSNPVNASIADDEGTGTILDDESEPAISIGDASEAEGDDLVFTISLSGVRDDDVTVNYSTANDSATAGSDYTGQSDVATIPAGSTSTTVTVPSTEDSVFEGDETFFVNLTGDGNFADDQGLGTIEDDDPAPTITVGDESESEGDDVVFTLTLSAAAEVDVTVQYQTVAGSAGAGADYTAQSDVATITAGTTSTTVTVPTIEDALFEADETFTLTLQNAVNATIADDEATGTIENDDATPSLIIDDVSLAEGSNLQFTVTLSAVAGVDVTFDFDTADDSATAGSDYIAQSDTGTIAAGTTTTTITVPSIEDAEFELDETFFVNLSSPANATIADDQGIGTIQNDEGVPTLTVEDAAAVEGNDVTFTITLSSAAGVDVTFDYATADDSATAGSDYTAQANTATIPAGSTSTTVSVPTSANASFEGDETFFLDLDNAANAALGDDQAVGTIEEGTAAPSVTIDDDSETEGDDLVFTLTLSQAAAVDISVTYETADDTATAGEDYGAQSGTAIIPAGSLTATITVPTTADTTFEDDETLFVNLTGSDFATIADDQGLGTIENDDVEAFADLSIGKTTPVTTFTPGQEVTYTITVANSGPLAATGITVTDVLPAGTSLVSATSPDAVCGGTTTVTCTIASLADGATATITLVVVATGTASITNTATVEAAFPADGAEGNNSAFAVIAPAAVANPGIPTLSEWGLLLLAMALAGVAVRRS